MLKRRVVNKDAISIVIVLGQFSLAVFPLTEKWLAEDAQTRVACLSALAAECLDAVTHDPDNARPDTWLLSPPVLSIFSPRRVRRTPPTPRRPLDKAVRRFTRASPPADVA